MITIYFQIGFMVMACSNAVMTIFAEFFADTLPDKDKVEPYLSIGIVLLMCGFMLFWPVLVIMLLRAQFNR